MNLSNKFLDLVNLPILNTDNTIRYSLMYQAKPESLSQHIAEVSLMSYVVGLELISLGEDIDIGLLLEKVILHDLDEVLTGDIPRTTKYYSDSGLEALRGVAQSAIETLGHSLPEGSRVVSNWATAKEGKEGLILELADMVCVARKSLNEVELLGNSYFLKVSIEMVDNLVYLRERLLSEAKSMDFKPESIEYIESLVSDAESIMREISDSYKVDKYRIKGNIFSSTYKGLVDE